MNTPPYRIETERLVIRCYEPRDAPLLKDAVDSSLDHLRQWMPWVEHEPQTLDEKIQLIRRFRGQFDKDENYVLGTFSRDESELVGGTGLHPRADDDVSLEIGYWIRASAVRNGYATETTAVLTRVAFEICGAERVDIRVDPANEASAAVPRKLGYTEEATLRRRLPPFGDQRHHRDTILFTMLAEELADSPCANAAFEAYDAAGRPVTRPS